MRTKYLLLVGAASLLLLATTAIVSARPGEASHRVVQSPFVQAVRDATTQYSDIEAAKAAGYGLLHGCVSGQDGGAMGLHYTNSALVGDGMLDPAQPEALLYEVHDGAYQLNAVEYVVLADAWDASHQGPPVLMGQLFNYVSSPNRYGLPAFYELHVWAWKTNPSGTFADWNPTVSCDEYTADGTMPMSHH